MEQNCTGLMAELSVLLVEFYTKEFNNNKQFILIVSEAILLALDYFFFYYSSWI